MALLMQESFDFYASLTSLLNSAWGRNGASVDLSSAGGRRGSRAANASGYSAGLSFSIIYTLPAENKGVLWWGFAFAQTVLAGVNTQWIQVQSAALASQFCLDITAAGRVRVKASVAGAVLAQSADGAIKLDGTYQYIEIMFQCAASAAVEVWVDGVSVLSGASLNLRQSGAGGCGRFYFGSPANLVGNTAYYDDMYLVDDTGNAPFNTRLGDWKVDSHLPTAEGDDHAWTHTAASVYQSINVVGSTYATDYIQSDTVGQQASVKITPGDMTTIQAVTIRAYCRNPGGGTAKMKPYVLIGGTRYYGDEVTLPADTCNLKEYTWLTNPVAPGTTAWVKNDLLPANAQFGWETTVLS